MLAEKDFQQIVKSDRAAVVAKQDTLSVGEHYHVGVDGSFDLQTKEGKSSAHLDMKADRIEISLDDAKVVLEKDTITLSAKKKIRIESEEGPIELFAKKGDVKIETKDGSVKIQGGPKVELNCPPDSQEEDSAGTPAKGKPKDPVQEAIDDLEKSDFAKTPEGQRVLEKIKEKQAQGKIKLEKLPDNVRGAYDGNNLIVNSKFSSNPDAIGSELVHEASHDIYDQTVPGAKNTKSIDEELFTNTNQLNYYIEQKKHGYVDPQLELRLIDMKDGKLRDNVKKRYPTYAEHPPAP